MPALIDVSASTSKTVLSPRIYNRRGIVIHTTEGTNSLSWLQGGSSIAGRPASSDFLIARNGDIYQITPPGMSSYHSGRARWNLYQEPDGSINQGFYGIELENSLDLGEVVTDLQYISLAWLSRSLVSMNHIPYFNITDHHMVALPFGRKKDPSGFDYWIFTRELLHPSPFSGIDAWKVRFP